MHELVKQEQDDGGDDDVANESAGSSRGEPGGEDFGHGCEAGPVVVSGKDLGLSDRLFYHMARCNKKGDGGTRLNVDGWSEEMTGLTQSRPVGAMESVGRDGSVTRQDWSHRRQWQL